MLKGMLLDGEVQTLHDMYFDVRDNKMLLVLTHKMSDLEFSEMLSVHFFLYLIFPYCFQNSKLTMLLTQCCCTLNDPGPALPHIHSAFPGIPSICLKAQVQFSQINFESSKRSPWEVILEEYFWLGSILKFRI